MARHCAAWILLAVGTWVSSFQIATDSAAQRETITGVVVDDTGPVHGALVRIQTTGVHTKTGIDGSFSLTTALLEGPLRLTAFAPGYYIAGPIAARPGDTDVTFKFVKHATVDDPSYEWIAAHNVGRSRHCERCHSDPTDVAAALPFDEWRNDAHATSAVNPRFLSMYRGTDLNGQQRSSATRYAYHRDYGKVPLVPDPEEPYFGPGVLLDGEPAAGNCAACHAPAAISRHTPAVDFNSLTAVGREGGTCDLCHKVWAVKTDPATKLPYPNRPGVLSMEFRRPPPGRQLFIGPFDDAAAGDDTYSPIMQQSEFCAPCHVGEFWGVRVYNSFGEWRASSFSNPASGRTCQDCHMPRRGATRVARAEVGGRARDPQTIFSHLMPGAADRDLLRAAARIDLRASWRRNQLQVEVAVTNQKAGHHIPTDHPARNVILLVAAMTTAGTSLEHVGNQVIPHWAGVGSGPGDYGGRPGKGYAKILEELWTGVAPTAAYWRPTRVLSDTRIPANATDSTQYSFAADGVAGDVRIEATLIYRRAFKDLAAQKGWDVRDVVMTTAQLRIRRPD